MVNSAEFGEFWTHYPRRVGKLAAQRAYQRARKQATADVILAGLKVAARHFPAEVQFIPHPATWLNQGRWMDEFPERVQPRGESEDWYEHCKRVHDGACGLDRWRHYTRVKLEAKAS